MADSIKIGNLDISAFKVGSSDCKVYLGSTLIYTGGTTPPTPQTLQWVEFNSGDTIPSDLDIYGISGTAQNLEATFHSDKGDINASDEGRNTYIVYVGYISGYYTYCYQTDVTSGSDTIELIFSNLGCADYYNQGTEVKSTIKLYIYA